MKSDVTTDLGFASDPDVRGLIRAYRNDNELAFDRLVKIYKPLIDGMISGYAERLSAVYERDDISQYVLIAFSKAVLTYNLGQEKVSFGLYAKVCIGNSLVSRLRTARRHNVEILPLDGVYEIADPLDISNDIIANENVGELSELIKDTLSDFENIVFSLSVTGYSSSEIAKKLGKTEKSVDNAVFRARNKLKAVLNGTNN